MRHRVAGRTLNRNTKARAGLLKSLARELVVRGSIVTTEPKAKELKRVADKLVSTAQKNSLIARRTLHRFFGKRDVVNTLVEQIVPAAGKRNSGFTRLIRQAQRAGDNAQMIRIEWVDAPEHNGSLKNPSPTERPAKKKATVAGTTKKIAKKPVVKAKTPTKKKAE